MSAVTIAPLAESLPAFLNANDSSAVAVLANKHTLKFCYQDVKPLLPKRTLICINTGE